MSCSASRPGPALNPCRSVALLCCVPLLAYLRGAPVDRKVVCLIQIKPRVMAQTKPLLSPRRVLMGSLTAVPVPSLKTKGASVSSSLTIGSPVTRRGKQLCLRNCLRRVSVVEEGKGCRAAHSNNKMRKFCVSRSFCSRHRYVASPHVRLSAVSVTCFSPSIVRSSYFSIVPLQQCRRADTCTTDYVLPLLRPVAF